MDPHATAVAEVARSLAQLVQSGRLARAGADRVTRELQIELQRTDELTSALVAVLDAVVMAVERSEPAIQRRGLHAYVHLETLLRGRDELRGREPLSALLMAVDSLPSAGIVSVGTRAVFEGVARRRYAVVDLELAKAFLFRRRPVLSR